MERDHFTRFQLFFETLLVLVGFQIMSPCGSDFGGQIQTCTQLQTTIRTLPAAFCIWFTTWSTFTEYKADGGLWQILTKDIILFLSRILTDLSTGATTDFEKPPAKPPATSLSSDMTLETSNAYVKWQQAPFVFSIAPRDMPLGCLCWPFYPKNLDIACQVCKIQT